MKLSLLVVLVACGHPQPKPSDEGGSQAGSSTVATNPVDAAPVATGSATAGSAVPPAGSGGGSATPANVLEWGGSGGRGTFAQLTIDATGTATALYSDGLTKKTRTGRVSSAELAKLADVLVKHHACALVADPKYIPVPEEHHTRLMANLPGVACTVELHQNEWGKSPDGKAIESAIGAIDAKLK